ncbi:hypothetical protein ABIE13_005411 [Ottowia thiooxydans]|uniref:Uncharacterized protein n=1 Tax=Ottowia thiooxydans TaxID=219182 RepID=A0ABV2QGU3_9BURK
MAEIVTEAGATTGIRGELTWTLADSPELNTRVAYPIQTCTCRFFLPVCLVLYEISAENLLVTY